MGDMKGGKRSKFAHAKSSSEPHCPALVVTESHNQVLTKGGAIKQISIGEIYRNIFRNEKTPSPALSL